MYNSVHFALTAIHKRYPDS